MRISFLLILSLSFTTVKSQQIKDDSVLQILNNNTLADTSKINKVLAAINIFAKNNDTSVVVYIDKCLAIAKKINDKSFEAKVYIQLGNYYIFTTNYAKAIIALNTAEKLLLKINTKHPLLAGVYASYGQVYLQDKKIELSTTYLEKSVKNIEQQPLVDTFAYVRAIYTLASNYIYDSIEISFQTYLKAYNIALLSKNEYLIATTSSGLGNIYSQMGIHRDSKYFNDAIAYANKAVDYYKKTNNFSKIGYPLTCIAQSYDNLDNTVMAVKYYKEAMSNFEQFDNKHLLDNSYLGLSYCYNNLGKNDSAFLYLDKYVELHNKLTSEERTKQIDQLSAQFETEKKENEIKNLQLKNQKRAILFGSIIGLLAFILLFAILLFNRFRIKKQNELLKIELEETAKRNAIELQKNQADLTALKSQMNPHFIFNALNSIQELYTIGDKKTANEQMANFATLTRKILDVSGKQKIDLADEIDILTKYLELEGIRFENDFVYQINLSKNIDVDYVQLPPMLIQPYVENSIKHGLLHKKGTKHLTLNFILNDDETNLVCEIIDNGIGRIASSEINKNRPQSHVSFSTSATEKRLQLLNQGKQENIAVLFDDIEDENKNALGTKVSIQIPIN